MLNITVTHGSTHFHIIKWTSYSTSIEYSINKLEDNNCRLMGMDVTWSSLQNQPRSSVFVQIGL